MRFYAHHGYYSEEQKIGAQFLVDLEMQTDFDEAAYRDDISGTVNYEAVYQMVKQEMSKPVQLIEHAASKILDRLKNEFSNIQKIKIKLSKLHPPINGEVEKVSVVLER